MTVDAAVADNAIIQTRTTVIQIIATKEMTVAKTKAKIPEKEGRTSPDSLIIIRLFFVSF